MDWADAWVGNPALERIVLAFGGPPRNDADTAHWLGELESFSDRWDFRRGVERDLASGTVLTPAQDELIFHAAAELGLRGSRPPERASYDAVLILGGLVTAAIARPKFAADLLDGSDLATGRVVALGGHRPLGPAELPLADRLMRPGIVDELDAMDWGVRNAFDLGTPHRQTANRSDTVGEAWAIREYRAPNGMLVDVIAAPSSEPGVRRANTADTYAWLAETTGILSRTDSILIVTTQIYCPFQAADAWRMLRLPHDVHVEVIGMVPGEVDPRLAQTQTFEPHKYLQEIRSAIIAMRRLYEAIDGA